MRILLIDKEESLLKFLVKGFKEFGYAVDSSADGERGLFYASTNEYDLIIRDIFLPGMGAEEICTSLRKNGKNYPIMILSADNKIETRVKFLEMGADDYLNKPFSLDELLARARSIVRRLYAVRGITKAIGRYELNIKERVLFKGEKRIELTKKEFSLLEFFIHNKNSVVSRAFIMEHVWDINGDPFSNTIETHIRNLRIKLGDYEDKKLIVTVPGVGYKLCCD